MGPQTMGPGGEGVMGWGATLKCRKEDLGSQYIRPDWIHMSDLRQKVRPILRQMPTTPDFRWTLERVGLPLEYWNSGGRGTSMKGLIQ